MENNLSLLISVYHKDKAEWLNESLRSVFCQTFRANEVILVEDGPLGAELEEIVLNFSSRFKELRVVKLDVNQGLGNALNEGLKHCSNDLVARMDSDDICFPNRFEKQFNFMMTNPEIDICSSWIQEFEGDVKNIRGVKKVPGTHRQVAGYIGMRNPINHPAVMFKKSAVLDAGGYKHFPLFEDWYLWARMFVNGAKFSNIQESLVYFRISPQMYKRRGGLKYTVDSTRFQWTLHRLGIISSVAAIKSSVIRAAVYMMPNKLRTFVYTNFLRS